MANIQERRDKNGKLISYSIRVFRGRGADGQQLKPWTTTFPVAPTWAEKSARRKAEAFAATFEKECREGVTSDTRLKFEAYCDYVIEQKELNGCKHSTIVRYKELTERIYPAIGYIKLKDLRVDHLNSLYAELLKTPLKRPSKATAKIDLASVCREKKVSRASISRKTGVAESTVSAAVRGKTVNMQAAKSISEALGLKFEKVFEVKEVSETLSPKTVNEYHGLISTVLEQAVKESLIPFNPASRATLPKLEQKEPDYFQPEEVAAIRDALESEPMKWKVLTHLYLITGARRGEILGLKWSEVDFERNRIHIHNNLLYAVDCGIYEDTPKTKKSQRYIVLPEQTMQLLKQWKAVQAAERLKLGEYYQNNDLLFTKTDGTPMHPDSITNWLKKFSKRHNLPHCHPHAFRHTMASMLYYSGMDSVSISKRLGHAQVSTTANIYAHVIESADQKSADILADVFLKTDKSL